MPENNKKLVQELNRRGVIRALVAYAVVIWLAATGLVDLFPAVGFPDWSIRLFLATAVAATPLVAFLAWRYNLTFKGVLRDPADVAVPRDTVARANSPTRRSTQQQNTAVGVVLATWKTTDGELCERQFQSEFIIGRDFQADVQMKDDRVSRRHLRVYPVDNEWHVKDLDSLNGSFVNGKSIDDIAVNSELDVSLDRHGPKVHLQVRVAEETAQSVSTRR
jgi:pSer/pThr/pTyr-binding forkhead associated (FHA) protein